MSTVRVGTFSVTRLPRNVVPSAAAGGTNETPTVKVTFVYTGLTGNQKQQGGKTWYEATGNWSFAPDSVEIAYGDTATIKIKMDNNASTNGWKLKQFIPKSTNPAGGPTAHDADANGDVTFTDSNSVAGTYAYGVYLESPSDSQYASYDPTIKQDGGGGGR